MDWDNTEPFAFMIFKMTDFKMCEPTRWVETYNLQILLLWFHLEQPMTLSKGSFIAVVLNTQA